MIVSIASGKGGTGKTFVATNLARVISEHDEVTLVDADVEEPNVNIFMRMDLSPCHDVSMPVPVIDETLCTHCHACEKACVYHALLVTADQVVVFPEICHACGGCGVVCPTGAVSERQRSVGTIQTACDGNLHFVQGTLNPGEVFSPTVIRALKSELRPARFTIMDCPPGSACAAVQAIKGSDLCLLVTEPTPFGLHDLAIAVEMAHSMGIDCAVVINRHGLGDAGVERYCEQSAIPVVARFPLERQVAEHCAQGHLVVDYLPDWRQRFLTLADQIRSRGDSRVR